MSRLALICLLVLPFAGSAARAQAVHDYENLPEARLLATPKTAIGHLPKRVDGRPDWVQALDQGLIAPRSTKSGEPRPADDAIAMPSAGIVFTNTQFMPHVVFPHRQHAEWLSCMNCHESLFELKATGKGKGMTAIFRGEHCGFCHGRVAFAPEGSCYRCHSQPNPNAMKANSPFVEPAAVEAPEQLEPLTTKRRGGRAAGNPDGRSSLRPAIVKPPAAPPAPTPAPAGLN
ncbi:MAG TPA: c(7)-type cytochrome triheme domain-containing protein [Rhodocyclaceae bacterium]|nr:c(7)-type cytochrome triheme domain-containing protein [Rhodocyclaceae bacterium]